MSEREGAELVLARSVPETLQGTRYPALAHLVGQGGFCHGMGQALLCQMLPDDRGRLKALSAYG